MRPAAAALRCENGGFPRLPTTSGHSSRLGGFKFGASEILLYETVFFLPFEETYMLNNSPGCV
jgi:hypothetical protein